MNKDQQAVIDQLRQFLPDWGYPPHVIAAICLELKEHLNTMNEDDCKAMTAPDQIDDLMTDLRTRGRARLISGRLGEPLAEEDVHAEVRRQYDLWDPEKFSEELVITLDTLETLLRWGRTISG